MVWWSSLKFAFPAVSLSIHPPMFSPTHQPTFTPVQALKEARDNMSFDALLKFPELHRFIDQDEVISKIFRTPKE